MIVHRYWTAEKTTKVGTTNFGYQVYCEGWFLFGIIPLYVRERARP